MRPCAVVCATVCDRACIFAPDIHRPEFPLCSFSLSVITFFEAFFLS